MRTLSKVTVLLASLALVGAGCFGSQQDSSRDGGIFISATSGQAWVQSVAYPTVQGVGSLATQSILTMAMDPQDHQTIYIGVQGKGMFFSYDRGVTWQSPREAFMQAGDIRSIAVHPTDSCTIFAVNGSRLYKSENCSRTFKSMYEESRSDVVPRKVAVDYYETNIVYLGLSNGDVLKSVDAGLNWTKILSTDSEVTGIAVSNVHSQNVFVTTDGDYIYRTQDKGSTWEKLEEPLKDYRNANEVSLFVQDATGETILIVTRRGLLRSKDLGDTWEEVTLVTDPGEVVIYAAAVDPGNPNTIYYATRTTFNTSTDGGASWDTSQLPSTRAGSVLLVDPVETAVLYLGVQTLEK